MAIVFFCVEHLCSSVVFALFCYIALILCIYMCFSLCLCVCVCVCVCVCRCVCVCVFVCALLVSLACRYFCVRPITTYILFCTSVLLVCHLMFVHCPMEFLMNEFS